MTAPAREHSVMPRAAGRERDESRSPPGQWRVLAAALIAWAVTSWAITTPGAALVVAFIAGAMGTALLAGLLLSRGTTRAAAFKMAASLLLLPCAITMLVATQVSAGEYVRHDPRFTAAAEAQQIIKFEAVLAGFAEFRETEFGSRGWVRIDAMADRGSLPLLMWLDEDIEISPLWGPGTVIEAEARIERQQPGDSIAYAATPVTVRHAVHQPLRSQLGVTAAHLRHLLTNTAADVSGAELVPGFAVGDTSLVSQALESAMLESSLTHLTAVSGSNTGLVIAAVVWSVSRLGCGRRLRVVAAALGLAGFVTVVGPDASVQRATAMAAVLLIADFGGRKSSAFAALGIAVVVLLSADPWQSLQPGFALSVAATGGILLFATPFSRWLRRRARLPGWLALPLSIALAAQLTCGPLLLLLQPGVPVVGVLANLLAAPAAPMGTGLGLIAALLAPLAPSLAQFTVWAASVPARWVAATAEVCAALPGARWSWPDGWGGAALLAGCELGLLAAWALHRGLLGVPFAGRKAPRQPWTHAPDAPRQVRLVAAVLTAAALAIVVGVTIAVPLSSRLTASQNWAIVACDVGQGDALLLRNAEQPFDVMLVDTGDNAAALEQCLDQFGVHRISLLVLSHDDRDHVGALESIIGRVDRALLAPTVQGEDEQQREVVRTLQQASVPFEIGVAGLTADRSPSGLSWAVLAPAAHSAPPDSNAASLVMLVDAGPVRVLLLGDTGAEEQTALLRAGYDVRAQVLKVAHHGSPDHEPSFAQAVSADWALVSVGAENGYGHPSVHTLADIARTGARILRTDVHGSVAIEAADDGTLRPWVQRIGDEAADVLAPVHDE